MNGTVVEVNTNKYGTYSKVKLAKDPADGMSQYLNIPGRYEMGDEVQVTVTLNNNATHTNPLAANQQTLLEMSQVDVNEKLREVTRG